MKKASINVDYLTQRLTVLEESYNKMNKHRSDENFYEVYLSVCVQEFEIILKQTGSLLKKRLRDFFASNKEVDKLTFKDIFRYSAKHSLINIEQSEQWLKYRDKGNSIGPEYEEGFGEEIVTILPEFIISAKEILKAIKK